MTRVDYDGLSRALHVTLPDGSTIDAAYDPAGNLIEEVETELSTTAALAPERFFATHHYDARGRAVLMFDGIGHASRRGYDSLDGVVLTSDSKGPITALLPRRSALGAGIVVPVNGHGNVTNFGYDGLGRMTAREQILSAGGQGDGTPFPQPAPTAANPSGTIVHQWLFSPDSLLIAANDSNGHSTEYSYDNAGRIANVHADDGTAVSFSYDGEGNLQQKLSATGAIVVHEHDLASGSSARPWPCRRAREPRSRRSSSTASRA